MQEFADTSQKRTPQRFYCRFEREETNVPTPAEVLKKPGMG